jgi:hypothetical protein
MSGTDLRKTGSIIQNKVPVLKKEVPTNTRSRRSTALVKEISTIIPFEILEPVKLKKNEPAKRKRIVSDVSEMVDSTVIKRVKQDKKNTKSSVK